jgi:histidine triad (HIT) family protein
LSKVARTPVLFAFVLVPRTKFIKNINGVLIGDMVGDIMTDDCIFCKIVKGDIPSAKVYEDPDTLAFLDIAPNSKGHTLVVSKQHHEALLETPDDVLAKLMTVSKKVAAAVMKGTGAGGFNFNQNNYRIAGQLVPHIHFHIIPRFEGDGLKFWPQKKYEEGEMEAVREKIEGALK